MQRLFDATENEYNINSNRKQIIVESVAHCTAESSLQLSPQTLKILEKAVEAKGDLAEDMDYKNIMMVQQLPLFEKFCQDCSERMVCKGDLYEITDSSVLQMIKEKIEKGSNDDGEMDGDKKNRVLHAEQLVAREIGL